MGISFRSMGDTLCITGVWWATGGVCLGFRKKRYIMAVMAVGIALFPGYWYDLDSLADFGVGIIAGCLFALVFALNVKKPRPSPSKPPWMAITLVAILAVGMLSPIGTIHSTVAALAESLLV